MNLKRGMVITVNLDPTKGSETGKIRPCVIVTNNRYNKRGPIITNITIQPSSENGLSKNQSRIVCKRAPLIIEKDWSKLKEC